MLCFCIFLEPCRRTQTTLCHALVIVTLLFPIYSGQHMLPPHQAPVKRPSKLGWQLALHGESQKWSQPDVGGPKGAVRSSVTQSAYLENFTANAVQISTLDNERSRMRRKMMVNATLEIDESLEMRQLPFARKHLSGRQIFSASSSNSSKFADKMQIGKSISANPYFQHTFRNGRRQKLHQIVPLDVSNLNADPQPPSSNRKIGRTLTGFDTSAEDDVGTEYVQRSVYFDKPIASYTTLITRMRRSVAESRHNTANLVDEALPSSASSRPEFLVDAVLGDEALANFSTADTNTSASGNDTVLKKRNCTEWTGGQYTMFQIGNLMCLVAFLVPHNFRASGVLMRSSLVGAMALFSAWASVKLCAMDMLLWYLTLTCVNLVHVCRLGYVLWPARITPELTDVYDKLFRPLKVPRVPFMQLAREGKIERLSAGHIYAEEDATPAATRLALLVSGRLSVSCDSTHLHYIFPNQFVDSPEWETNREVEQPTELFQVTVASDDDSVLLVWQRDKLLNLLATNESLSAVIFNLVGRDITTKLYSLTEQQEQQRSNSTSMLMPGDRVRPLLRSVGAGHSRSGRSPPRHSNQMQLARQILDSDPGSSEKPCSSNKTAACSNVKKQTSCDHGGYAAVRETSAAFPRTSPELLDQTPPSVINGANQEVQSSRDDTQTPHLRYTDDAELASTGKGSDTEGNELSSGITHKGGVMRYRDLAQKLE